MKSIDIKEFNISFIENIQKGDVIITKRDKPLAVIVEHSHYIKMSAKCELSQEKKISILKGLQDSIALSDHRMRGRNV